MIADTSFLIDFMEGKVDAVTKSSELLKLGEPLFMTAISSFELHTGLARSDRPKQEKEKIQRALAYITALPLTVAAAEEAGIIHGQLIKEGNRIDQNDCLIAGIALVRQEAVLTKNVKHFSKIKNLKIDTY